MILNLVILLIIRGAVVGWFLRKEDIGPRDGPKFSIRGRVGANEKGVIVRGR